MKILLYFTFLIISILYAPLYPLLRATRQISSVRTRPLGTTQFNIRNISQRSYLKTPAQDSNRFFHSKYVPQSFSTGWVWAQNRIRQFFLGKTTTDIIQEIKDGKDSAENSFLDFVKKNNQDGVDTLLDELLIFADKQQKDAEMEFLTRIVRKLAFDKDPDRFIIKKIARWTSFRFMKLLTFPVIKEGQKTQENHITKEGQVYLEELITCIIGAEYIVEDKKNEETKPILLQTIEQNIEDICKTETGLIFLIRMKPEGAHLLTSKLMEYSPRLGGALIWEWGKILTTMKKKYEILRPILEKTPEGRHILKKIQPEPASTITDPTVIE